MQISIHAELPVLPISIRNKYKFSPEVASSDLTGAILAAA